MWKIIKEELKELTNTRWKLLGLILLLITPALYALLFLTAFNKPIHNADNASIKVVSLDKTNNSKYSKGLAKAMVGKHEIDVHTDKYYMTVVDATKVYSSNAEVEHDVNKGKIDGAFIIPDGFANDMKKATMDIIAAAKNPNAPAVNFPKITFYTSYKYNYVSARLLNMRANVISLKLNFLNSAIKEAVSEFGLVLPKGFDINKYYQNARDNFINYNAIGKDIKDYGNGLYPYFFSIALWAGCIMMIFMYKNRRIGPNAKRAGTFKNYFAKMITWLVTAWIQSALMVGAGFATGLVIDANPGYLLAYTMFVATIFALIVQGISSIFRIGEVGSFVVLILLVTQLAVSGGIFPATMQEPIWQKLSPLVPFTYTIQSFKEFLCQPDNVTIWLKQWPIFIYLIIIPVSLTINYIADKKRFKKYGHYTSHDPELHDEM